MAIPTILRSIDASLKDILQRMATVESNQQAITDVVQVIANNVKEDPVELAALQAQLKASSDALKAAVDANKPQ